MANASEAVPCGSASRIAGCCFPKESLLQPLNPIEHQALNKGRAGLKIESGLRDLNEGYSLQGSFVFSNPGFSEHQMKTRFSIYTLLVLIALVSRLPNPTRPELKGGLNTHAPGLRANSHPAEVSTKPSPAKHSAPAPALASEPGSGAEELDDEVIKVLNGKELSKTEKNKLRRICTPKPSSGRLEVPQAIANKWLDVSKGRDEIFMMWAKCGGVKAAGLGKIV